VAEHRQCRTDIWDDVPRALQAAGVEEGL